MSGKPSSKATKGALEQTLLPRLRFPQFRGAQWWSNQTLGSLFIQREETGYAHLRLLSLMDKEGIIPQEDSNRKNNASGDLSKYLRVAPGDIVYNTMRMWEGRSALSALEGIVSPAYTICRPSPRANSLFFSYYFKTPQLIAEFARFSQGLVKDTLNLKFDAFARISVATPDDPAEQERIAECLSSVDQLIATQARKVAALKTHKKGLMQQLFPREGEAQPRLRFPEFRNAGEWEVKRLGEIVEVASGQVDPKEQPYRDYPQIGSENIEANTGNLINLRTAREKGVISGNYLFDQEDVLYSKIRPALNKVVAPGFKGICSADIYPIRPSNAGLHRSYLMFLLLSERFLAYAIRNSERGKIPKINRDALLTYEAQVPSLAEQQRIAFCLLSLDALINSETRKYSVLQRYKRGLLQQLFPSSAEEES